MTGDGLNRAKRVIAAAPIVFCINHHIIRTSSTSPTSANEDLSFRFQFIQQATEMRDLFTREVFAGDHRADQRRRRNDVVVCQYPVQVLVCVS